LDVFGGNRRNVEAAMAAIAGSVEYYRDVVVTLSGEVAINYIHLRMLQQQIDIAKANLKDHVKLRQ
jgi:outer membrane protein TolC